MSIYLKNENIVLREIHNSYFLIDIKANYLNDQCVLNEINEIGAFILKQLSVPRDIGEVVKFLQNELKDDISYDILYEDVKEYIQYLLQIGVVRESE